MNPDCHIAKVGSRSIPPETFILLRPIVFWRRLFEQGPQKWGVGNLGFRGLCFLPFHLAFIEEEFKEYIIMKN